MFILQYKLETLSKNPVYTILDIACVLWQWCHLPPDTWVTIVSTDHHSTVPLHCSPPAVSKIKLRNLNFLLFSNISPHCWPHWDNFHFSLHLRKSLLKLERECWCRGWLKCVGSCWSHVGSISYSACGRRGWSVECWQHGLDIRLDMAGHTQQTQPLLLQLLSFAKPHLLLSIPQIVQYTWPADTELLLTFSSNLSRIIHN